MIEEVIDHRNVHKRGGTTAGLDRFYAAVGRCADKRGRQQDASGHGEGALKMAKLVGTLCDDRAMVWVWLVLWRIVLSHSDNQRAQTISATFFLTNIRSADMAISSRFGPRRSWELEVQGADQQQRAKEGTVVF